ncbi:hypothetical protein CENSYa_0304 [Cenarchaeum symbiosum A]|uniref:Uncharacterized protein n=1 Tax=Cenarchaeum symbiosum (strain A) TaxID=414004 RepID=A0RUC4_CENSY|nr:hypothetical protein CENSYa_0304 [Cenarchaeum symbiosum A]
MSCKGICLRYKAKKPVSGGRYENGQKRCQMCDIFINWDGIHCPCCGYRTRGVPRNVKWKKRLRTKMTGAAQT